MAVDLNLLALDVGERRVGTALASTASRLSSPNKTLNQSDQIWDEIGNIIEKEDIGIVVIGLPRNLNGDETDQTRYVREFSDKFATHFDIPFFLEDEALSSVRAKESLDSSGKNYAKEDIDSFAACYILDDFMANHPEDLNG